MPANTNQPVPEDRNKQQHESASNDATSKKENSSDEAAKAQERLFIQDLIASGKAAVAKDGKLPPGATHEIVGHDSEGYPIVVRRRYY